jgi:superfamily II DNA or RNA helicase
MIVQKLGLYHKLVSFKSQNKQVHSTPKEKETFITPLPVLDKVSEILKEQIKEEQRANTFWGKFEKVVKQTWQKLTGTKANPDFTQLVTQEDGSYAFAMGMDDREAGEKALTGLRAYFDGSPERMEDWKTLKEIFEGDEFKEFSNYEKKMSALQKRLKESPSEYINKRLPPELITYLLALPSKDKTLKELNNKEGLTYFKLFEELEHHGLGLTALGIEFIQDTEKALTGLRAYFDGSREKREEWKALKEVFEGDEFKELESFEKKISALQKSLKESPDKYIGKNLPPKLIACLLALPIGDRPLKELNNKEGLTYSGLFKELQHCGLGLTALGIKLIKDPEKALSRLRAYFDGSPERLEEWKALEAIFGGNEFNGLKGYGQKMPALQKSLKESPEEYIKEGLSPELIAYLLALPSSNQTLQKLNNKEGLTYSELFIELKDKVYPEKQLAEPENKINQLLEFLQDPANQELFKINPTELYPIFLVLIKNNYKDINLTDKQIFGLVSSLKADFLAKLLNPELDNEVKIELIQNALKAQSNGKSDELSIANPAELAKIQTKSTIGGISEAVSPKQIFSQAELSNQFGQTVAGLPETIKSVAINELWQTLFNKPLKEEALFITEIETLNLENFGSDIRNSFLQEFKAVNELRNTKLTDIGYRADLEFTPNLMQYLNAVRLKQEKHILNASGTGLGKTDAAMLGLQLLQSEMNLVITNNATVGQWITVLNNKLDPSKVEIIAYSPSKDPRLAEVSQRGSFEKLKQDIKTAQDNNKQVYLVINYDKFNRENADLIDNLTSLGFDAVIADEAHNIKAGENSNTGSNIINLMNKLREKKPNLNSIFSTATPVIELPEEVKYILEAITGDKFPINPKKTIGNILAARQALAAFMLRIENQTNLQNHILQTGWENPNLNIEYTKTEDPEKEERRIALIDKLRRAKHPADIETALIEAKADLIATQCLSSLPENSPKTIIYTDYIKDGTIDTLKKALKAQGFKEEEIAVYSGKEKEADKFINENAKVLIMTEAGAEGLDGLQTVANKIIWATLPPTPARKHQASGRVRRQGGFSETEEIIPTITIQAENGEFLPVYELMKYNVLEKKEIMISAIVNGTELPENFMPPFESLLGYVQTKIEECSPDEISKLFKELSEIQTETIQTQKKAPAEQSETQLNYSKFRELTKKLKSLTGEQAHEFLQTKAGKEDWKAYHEDLNKLFFGRRKPLDDIITNFLMKAPSQFFKGENPVILNLGCGTDLFEQRLNRPATPEMKDNKQTFKNWLSVREFNNIEVIEIDHVAMEGSKVKAGNIATMIDEGLVEENSADLAIFSLSLRGKDIDDYLLQAYFAIKTGGKLIIADHKNVFDKEKRKDLKIKLESLGFSNCEITEIDDYFFIKATKN